MAEYTVKYLDGEQEETTWVSRAGKAEVAYPNGHTYVGEFNEAGKKHGAGVYTWNVVPAEDAEEEEGEPLPPAVYDGSYVLGSRSGVGKMTFPDGGVYYGEWSGNQMHGEGTYKYPNGDVYSGEWARGQKSGKGKYLFKYGDSLFDGTWEAGDIATGVWSYPDGTTFTGPFMDGFPCGMGTYRFKSGNVQRGEFIRVADKSPDNTDEFKTAPKWLNAGRVFKAEDA